MVDGAMGLPKVLAGLGDLGLFDSRFFRQAQFGMHSVEKSKYFNPAFKAPHMLPSLHLPPTHPALWPRRTACLSSAPHEATPCSCRFLYLNDLIPLSTLANSFEGHPRSHLLMKPFPQMPGMQSVVGMPDPHLMAAITSSSFLYSNAREEVCAGSVNEGVSEQANEFVRPKALNEQSPLLRSPA